MAAFGGGGETGLAVSTSVVGGPRFRNDAVLFYVPRKRLLLSSPAAWVQHVSADIPLWRLVCTKFGRPP